VEKVRDGVTFVQESVAELKKATWPKWPEVRGTTTVVIIAVFIFALYLSVADLFLGYLYRMTMGLIR
jgi:preprotein translocase subunit SecE